MSGALLLLAYVSAVLAVLSAVHSALAVDLLPGLAKAVLEMVNQHESNLAVQ